MGTNQPAGQQPRALVIYWSGTGNTEKVARTIHRTLECQGLDARLMTVAEASDVELYDYDLVALGAPSYMWSPPDPVRDFIKQKMRIHTDRSDIKLGAPKMPGKWAAVFCTYSGPHTGQREATPVGKYMAQFFEHLGFEVLGEWYTIGEFHGRNDRSTQGRLGDIRGRPNAEDLEKVARDVTDFVRSIRAES